MCLTVSRRFENRGACHTLQMASVVGSPEAEPEISIVYVEDDSRLAQLTSQYLGSHHVRVFLVARRPRAQSVVSALPAARVHEVGRYGSRWLYSNR